MRFFYALVPVIVTFIRDSMDKSAKKGAPIAGNFSSACPLGEQTEKCRLQANKSPRGIGGRLFNPRPAMERGSFCYKPKGQALEVQATTACCGSVSSGMHHDGLCVGLQTNVVGCSQFHRCCRLEYGSDNKDYDACI
ncbi:hypothetical protein MGU_07072 [Metarhizium guizhouense ARSEF 977]|uniref:Uncharacterized protein n=1 Tax=Metarhizium guizhouense (strain ARSEF 977) TaxID=1276136 RepID=A0A0B4I0L2_METGA|nr:hypothetical protein MGU_07072 [Metarhizium guizhouense ARSEF 977]